MSTWLITGCSSGLGRSLAKAALAAGHKVVLTARNIDAISDLLTGNEERAIAVPLDVTDAPQITQAVESAIARFGQLDVLVNNAGYGYRAAVEEGNDSEIADLFAVNFFGAAAMIRVVLPHMRKRRSGTIVNVSSIAGRVTKPGSGYYSATKFALEGLSDVLRLELEPLSIGVMLVEPGAFRTDFAGRSLKQTAIEIDDYAATAGLRRRENDQGRGRERGDPDRASKIIVDLVDGPERPFRLLLGTDAVERVTQELDAQMDEVKKWSGVSVASDFER